jgi:hypothetical protein
MLRAQGSHVLRSTQNQVDRYQSSIYRYDPDKDDKPYMKDYDVRAGADRQHAARRADPHQVDG